MADIDWPTTLYGLILEEGFQETPPQTSIRTDMDVGPPKIRRRGTAGIRKISFMLFLTKTLVGTLDTFFTTTTKSGSLAFNFKLPRTEVSSEYLFAAEPIYTPRDDGYVASCQLELLP